jgi:glycerophosphoryl diester phosphodiesterase
VHNACLVFAIWLLPMRRLDYTAEEARRLLTFNKHYDEFGCGPDEITHPDDDDTNNNHYCYIHTLEEVLATLRDHPDVKPEFTIKIELKGPATAAPTVELVRKLDMRHRCHYSSFDHSRIAEVRALDEDAITGALFGDYVPHNFSDIAISVGASEVHLKYDTATFERVRIAHRVGLNTMAWFRGPIGMKEDYLTRYFDVGNEDEEMYKTVLRSGVQSLCVNRPDVLAKALA